MAFDIVDFALRFLEDYGLIAIFILLVLDGALLLPVFPGEIVMIMAVATYGTDPAGLVMLIILTTAAGLVGSLILYGICRGGGRRLVEKYPRLFMMPRKRREKLERSFQRPVGQSMVLFLRVIPLTRIIVNIPAGLAKMPIVRFLVLSVIGLTAYHTAFLWFTYEANRADSPVATKKQELEQAYASPAWDFMQTNQVVTGIGILAVGAVIAVRAAAQMHKDPEESAGSLVGFLTTIILFWGGVAVAVATYMEPEAVYDLLAVGGVDIHSVAAALGYPAVVVVWGASGVAVVFGLILIRMRKSAKRRKKRFEAMQRFRAKRETDQRVHAAVRPPSSPPEDPRHPAYHAKLDRPSWPPQEDRSGEVEFDEDEPAREGDADERSRRGADRSE